MEYSGLGWDGGSEMVERFVLQAVARATLDQIAETAIDLAAGTVPALNHVLAVCFEARLAEGEAGGERSGAARCPEWADRG